MNSCKRIIDWVYSFFGNTKKPCPSCGKKLDKRYKWL